MRRSFNPGIPLLCCRENSTPDFSTGLACHNLCIIYVILIIQMMNSCLNAYISMLSHVRLASHFDLLYIALQNP